MNATAPTPSGASPALAAFLRGSGRRALLFSQLQCGDPARGDAAATAALAPFVATAATLPMAQWPRRFWSGLLSQPLVRPGPAAQWPPAFAALGEVGPGARAALLLWLVAGLGEEDAAAALGVGVPAWRLALQRAAPHDATGQLDTGTWRALESEVRDTLRALPAERLAAWERACESAAPAAPPPRLLQEAPARRAPRWLVPALVACVLALAATFLVPWPARDLRSADDAQAPGAAPVVQQSALPDRDAPATFEAGDTAALLLHPDFQLLAGGGDTPLLRDLAFHAWHAAQRAGDGTGTEDTDAQ